jgi:hypothetical protein
MGSSVIGRPDPQIERLLRGFEENLNARLGAGRAEKARTAPEESGGAEGAGRAVLGVSSSPRERGNSTLILRKVLEGAEERGVRTEFRALNGMRARGCQACCWCQTYEGCALKDEVSPLLEEIRSARGLVLASPVYMGMLCAQMKGLLDRLFRFFDVRARRSRLERPIPTVLILAQRNPDPGAYRAHREQVEEELGSLGFPVRRTIVAAGVPQAGDVLLDDRVLAEALEAGRSLVEG